MITDEFQTASTIERLRDWVFGEHKRPERIETFTPRRRPSEWLCIIWHRIGVRCTAHALGLEAYYRTYNAEKRDEWVPQIREDTDEFRATRSQASL
jgi:hypothetical protein